MKIVVFNDTRVTWRLHANSERGVLGENKIPKHSAVTFEGPGEVFVKVWGTMVMVCFSPPGVALPTGRWPRLPSETARRREELRAGLHAARRDSLLDRRRT